MTYLLEPAIKQPRNSGCVFEDERYCGAPGRARLICCALKRRAGLTPGSADIFLEYDIETCADR